MSTAEDRPTRRPPSEVARYEGEWVWAELVDDDEPGPAHDDVPGGPSRSRQAAQRAAHCARTVIGFIAGHTGPGLRHAWALTLHWTSAAYMSDEELRRRLVKRHLDEYTQQRDDASAGVQQVNKKLKKLTADAAAFGLDSAEKQQMRDLMSELLRRRAGLTALEKIPFDPTQVQPTTEQIRRARSVMALQRAALGALPAALGIGALAVTAPLAFLLALPLVAAGAWWLGQHPVELTQRALPADLMHPLLAPPGTAAVTSEDPTLEDELKPYPIAQATTPEEAAEALRRAIIHEGGDVEQVEPAVKEPWGWSVRVSFTTGSPDDLNKDETYKRLITLLKVRRNGLLIEGDPDFGDSCTVRIIMRDPFTPDLVGTVPYRAPLSGSVTDAFDFGVAMDATPLAFALAGLMLLMVADSGGGKSGIMLAMAEAVTSTRDAVVVNLDPVGTGVGALGPAITLDACMDDDLICAVLEFFLTLCSARARQRAAYRWGNKWRVSPEHPAFCLFIDEWPQLSAKAKALLIRLLLLGRKEAIWVFGGSQFGTKDYLGEAIGPKLSAKVLGACRRVDVTELLGGGALAEGYRADLIRAATHTERNDAGQIYAQGLPGMPDRPVRYQVREILPDYAAMVGDERAAAGLPDVTRTLTEAGLLDDWLELQAACATGTVPDAEGGEGVEGDNAPAILLSIAEAFIRESEPPYLTMDQIHAHLRKDDPTRWGRWDERDDRGRLRELGKALSRELRNAKVELSSERITELDGQPRGYYLEAVRQALENLS
ncbi:hypothetical protein ACH4U6_35615 [Streptomyces netropsis]|uniref:hypothetical protein n=1 Tax=Streptomyces netropsis TaxID=55404 RepID=UPI0037988353